MEEHGQGYFIGNDDNTFADIIQFEGDGADLNEDGFPDGRLRPDRLHNLDGSLYIEQRFEVEILTNGLDLRNTTLTILDKNNTADPLIIISFGSSTTNGHVIPITGRSESDIRDDIIDLIVFEMEAKPRSSADITTAPLIDQNLTSGTSFEFHALSRECNEQ